MNLVKSFLIDVTMNQRLWQISKAGIQKRLGEWVGKPLIYYLEGGKPTHPEYPTRAESLKRQEEYRVGTIETVGFDERTDNYWAISSVKDGKVWELLKKGRLAVSPSVHPVEGVEIAGMSVLEDALPTHLAIVEEGAYGMQAVTVGTCEGPVSECAAELAPLIAGAACPTAALQASVEELRMDMIALDVAVLKRDIERHISYMSR